MWSSSVPRKGGISRERKKRREWCLGLYLRRRRRAGPACSSGVGEGHTGRAPTPLRGTEGPFFPGISWGAAMVAEEMMSRLILEKHEKICMK
ncbi:uncharacterized protein LOC144456898 isoform X5 [Phascolarctos cinereus]